jgi:hypothetical protein
MTNSMIRTVAEAIVREMDNGWSEGVMNVRREMTLEQLHASGDVIDIVWTVSDMMKVARAALEAMQEPTSAMKMAGAEKITAEIMKANANYDAACDAWPAMINAALSEETGA